MSLRQSLSTLMSFGLLFVVAPIAYSQAEAPYDLVITHGHIIDGTGSPWYSGDVGIRDGRIAAIGDLERRAAHSAPSTRRAWWWRPDSSTCWANRS